MRSTNKCLEILPLLSSKDLFLPSVKIVKGINQQRYTINYSHWPMLSYLLLALFNLSLAFNSKIIFFLCIWAYNLSLGYDVIAYLNSTIIERQLAIWTTLYTKEVAPLTRTFTFSFSTVTTFAAIKSKIYYCVIHRKWLLSDDLEATVKHNNTKIPDNWPYENRLFVTNTL